MAGYGELITLTLRLHTVIGIRSCLPELQPAWPAVTTWLWWVKVLGIVAGRSADWPFQRGWGCLVAGDGVHA